MSPGSDTLGACRRRAGGFPLPPRGPVRRTLPAYIGVLGRRGRQRSSVGSGQRTGVVGAPPRWANPSDRQDLFPPWAADPRVAAPVKGDREGAPLGGTVAACMPACSALRCTRDACHTRPAGSARAKSAAAQAVGARQRILACHGLCGPAAAAVRAHFERLRWGDDI